MPAANQPITDQELDRLADGELAPAEVRDLLAALESAPGGWRRCALAFVQSQALRRGLTQYCAPAPVTRDAATPPARVASRPTSRLGWLATAASLVVAFGAGMAASLSVRPAGHDAQRVAADLTQPSITAPDPVTAPIDALVQGPPQRAVQADADVVTFWTQDANGQRHTLPARLVDAEEINERLGVRFRSAVSPQVRTRLEQQGYRFESRKRYAPLGIDDGRTLIVPVEDMRLEPMPLEYL